MTKYRSESQISDVICQKSDVFKLRSADERGSTNGRVGARDSVREILATLPTTYIWSPKVIDGGSSTDRSCAVPRTHNTFGDRSFAVAGPRVWNSLPAHLRDEDVTHGGFRRELKTFCFNVASGVQ